MYVAVTLAFLYVAVKGQLNLVAQKQAKLHVLEFEEMNIAWNFRHTKYCCQ